MGTGVTLHTVQDRVNHTAQPLDLYPGPLTSLSIWVLVSNNTPSIHCTFEGTSGEQMWFLMVRTPGPHSIHS